MPDFKRFDGDIDELAIVVAFDPGGTTGWCVAGVDPRVLTDDSTVLLSGLRYFDYGQIDCGTRHGETGVGVHRGHDGMNLPGEFDGIRLMMNILENFDHCAVVTEDFVLDVKKANMGRDLLSPVRIIAGLSALIQFHYGKEAMNAFFIQNRSLAKTTCTDDRLKNWKVYDRNSGPHARDAVRHALYFLRDCRGNNDRSAFRRHCAWPDLFDDPAVRKNADELEEKKKRQAKVGERVNGLG